MASGLVGQGRLAEPPVIADTLRLVLARNGDLAGWKVVVTAGGTQEPIDPVRYVSNHSSGKMGYAIAEAARDRGASVVLISAPTALSAPYGVELRKVRSAADMHDALPYIAVGVVLWGFITGCIVEGANVKVHLRRPAVTLISQRRTTRRAKPALHARRRRMECKLSPRERDIGPLIAGIG